MTDVQRIAEALNKARKVYPHSKITSDQLDEYLDDLADLPADVVVQAIRECRRTHEFFPTLYAIRTRATEIIGQGAIVDAEAAWGEVLREVRRVGANPMPVFHQGRMFPAPEPAFSSPMIDRAVESIGFKDICLTDADDLGTLRAQFRDALRAIQRREVDRIVSGRATGSSDALTAGDDGDIRQLGKGAA